MKLFNYWRSTSSWRVRIALAYKQMPYDYVAVNLVREGGEQHGATYRQLNPLAEVPALIIALDNDEHCITQSMAILELLEELQPTPALLPADPYMRAKARQLAHMVSAGIQPHQNLATMQHVEKELHGDPKAWARHFIMRGLAALEQEAQKTHGLCLIDDDVTFADLCLVPQLYAARRFEVDLQPFRTLTRVDAHLSALPEFAAAHPDRQPDAPSA